MKWVWVVTTALSIIPTLVTLLDAGARCRRLVMRGRNGILKRDCDHIRRRELFRVCKHGLLVIGVWLAFANVPLPFGWDRVQARTFIMITVAWMLSVTSILDYRYHKTVECDGLPSDPPEPPVPPKEMQL